VIPEGGRNAALASVGGSMRRVGFGTEPIAAALNALNTASCSPALDGSEIDSIANSMARYAPSDPGAILTTLTDAGNADRFARDWSDQVHYVPEWGKWLVWQDNHWAKDETSGVLELAKKSARRINVEASAIEDLETQKLVSKHARQSQQLPRLKAMLELAQSIPEMIVRSAALDKDPLLLGVKNGTIDLRNGKLRPAKQSDFITRQAPIEFDPDAQCPEFRKFLSSVMAEDAELIEYLQRILGYCLTGRTDEQCLFFLYGSGANGKTTLLNVIKDTLGGDYCKQTTSESLMVQHHGRSSTNDLARLQGARVVLSNEVEEGSRLSESLIKQMTGGDPISARFLYEEFFEFVPLFKLLVAGNHQPVIRGTDTGIWRRLHLVPFTVTIPAEKRDPRLPDRLRKELPGILNFAVRGCLEWQKTRICPPKQITEAVAEYKSEMDLLAQWITENCVVRADLQIQASVAYSD
jgi:putative DNA primase/helicase